MRRWAHRTHLAGLFLAAAALACRPTNRATPPPPPPPATSPGAAGAVATVAGRGGAGAALPRGIDSLLHAPAPPAPAAARRRVAFVVWDNPPMVIGGGSYLDELATLAGTENVFHDIPAASATVSLETIAARDPDVIAVLADSGAPAVPAWAARREWQVVRAVRERRFAVLGGSLFARPSPRAPQAVAALRRALAATR